MSRTVHLHIGLAKSGTTYLQHILQANRTLLEGNGVLFPGPKMSEHFMAALDLSGATFGGHRPAGTDGAWERVSAAANQYPATTLISHEMLAPIPRETIARAVDSLGAADVRVVVTARDFGRQVPAVWQERLKNGSQERYGEFLESLFDSDEGRKHRGGFWRMQSLIGISRRWAEVVGADRLTVVTVPPAGADAGELWRRFAAAVDLPDLDYGFDVEKRNPSLGVVESELLRRLNGHLPELAWPQHVRRVKRRFAEGTLAAASASGRLVVAGEHQQEVALVAEQTIAHLRGLDCRVVGDLEDLRPTFPESDPPTPDWVQESAVLDLALAQLGRYVSRPPAPQPAPGRAAGQRGLVRRFLGRLRGRLRGALDAR